MKVHGARRLASLLRSTVASSALSSAFSGALSDALPGVLSGARRWRVAVAAAVTIPALVACSSVPDEVNPVSWYEGVTGWFDDDGEETAEYEDEDEDDEDDSWFGSDDDDEEEEEEDDSSWFSSDDDEYEELAEDSDEFPNLASVPDRPAAMHNGDITEGLVADPNRPEYAPAVKRQGEAQLALGQTQPAAAVASASGASAPRPQISGDYQPAPAPMPKTPVMSAELTPGGQAQTQAPAQAPASGLTPPPPPVFAAAPMAMPATPPYQTAAVGGVVLTPPSSRAASAAPSAAVQRGGTPLPAVLTDTSSHQAFEFFRAQMRQGAAGVQFMHTPYAAAAGGGYAAQQPTIVISSGGVAVQNPGYGGGFASAGAAMPAAQAAQPASRLNAMNAPRTVLAPGSVKVATILFSNGSASLKGEDKGILNQVAALQKRNGGTVRVVGHASSRTRTMDPDRHRTVNYEISASRADAVAGALMRLGVPPESIMVGAVADAEPLFYEVMPSGEAGNRRAEIYLDT